MKAVLVTEQRGWDDTEIMHAVLDRLQPDYVIADHPAVVSWANEHDIACTTYAANWEKWGGIAGSIRNAHMIYALEEHREQNHDCLVVAFLDEAQHGESMVTRNCVKQAMREGFRAIDAGKWLAKQQT